MPNAATKQIIRAWEFVFRKMCQVMVWVRVRKIKIIHVNDKVRKFSVFKLFPVQ